MSMPLLAIHPLFVIKISLSNIEPLHFVLCGMRGCIQIASPIHGYRFWLPRLQFSKMEAGWQW